MADSLKVAGLFFGILLFGFDEKTDDGDAQVNLTAATVLQYTANALVRPLHGRSYIMYSYSCAYVPWR